MEAKQKQQNSIAVSYTHLDVYKRQGLRSILRQDPDIVMLGEIRDTETAEIAVRAAITGHLVLSTIHTNDAPSSIAVSYTHLLKNIE